MTNWQGVPALYTRDLGRGRIWLRVRLRLRPKVESHMWLPNQKPDSSKQSVSAQSDESRLPARTYTSIGNFRLSARITKRSMFWVQWSTGHCKTEWSWKLTSQATQRAPVQHDRTKTHRAIPVASWLLSVMCRWRCAVRCILESRYICEVNMHAIKLCFGYVVPLVLGYKIMPGGSNISQNWWNDNTFGNSNSWACRPVKSVWQG